MTLDELIIELQKLKDKGVEGDIDICLRYEDSNLSPYLGRLEELAGEIHLIELGY